MGAGLQIGCLSDARRRQIDRRCSSAAITCAHVGAAGQRARATCGRSAPSSRIGSVEDGRATARRKRAHDLVLARRSAEREGRCDACGRPRDVVACARARPPTGLTRSHSAAARAKVLPDGQKTDGRNQKDGPGDTTHDQATGSAAARTDDDAGALDDLSSQRHRLTFDSAGGAFSACPLFVPAPTWARL